MDSERGTQMISHLGKKPQTPPYFIIRTLSAWFTDKMACSQSYKFMQQSFPADDSFIIEYKKKKTE